MLGAFLPSLAEFHRDFGLTKARLATLKPDAIVMHPGPINRGVEIGGDVAYGPQSLILQQVSHGIAVRMAVMSMILDESDTKRSDRSEEHTSELQSLMRISYAVFCLKKKTKVKQTQK